MKRTLHPGLLALLVAFVVAFPCLAQVPGTMSYQGRVTASGTNVNGPGQFQFALVTPAPSGARQATGLATISGGFLTIVTITDGGSGYLTAPAVTATGGGGSGATFTAHVSAGIVTGITVNNPGGGYTSIPTITIAPPPVLPAFTTLWSHDGTSANGGPPASPLSLNVQDGLFTVILGDTNLPNMLAIPTSVFTNGDVRLRIWFADGTNQPVPLSPDQRLSAVAYAMIADNVRDGAITASKLAPGAIGSAQLAPNLTISGSVIASSFTGSGAGLSNLPLATLQGALAWQVIAGTNQQAVPNSSYLFTNEQQGTLTLPPSPPVGSSIRVAGSGAAGWRVVANPGQTIANLDAFGWASARLPRFSWKDIASSTDGGKLIVVERNGIATSTDSGETWILRETNSNLSLTSVASSSDGSKLLAGGITGYLYTSSDSGLSWTPRMTDGARNWMDVATSSDGTKLIAGEQNGIYVSSDSGASWSLRLAGTNGSWNAVASSADGNILLAHGRSNGLYQLFASYDSGISWVPRTTYSDYLQIVALSADGLRHFGFHENSLFVSTNSGNTWTRTEFGFYFDGLAVSDDGLTLATVQHTGGRAYVVVSVNGGQTWQKRQAVEPFGDRSWLLTFADSGRRLYASTYDTIYRSPANASMGFSAVVSGFRNASIELIYTGNNQFMPVNSVGEISVE